MTNFTANIVKYSLIRSFNVYFCYYWFSYDHKFLKLLNIFYLKVRMSYVVILVWLFIYEKLLSYA